MTKTSKQQSNMIFKTRFSKIKGQVNGLEAMLEKNTNCLEVLNQVSAIRGALSSLGLEIMKSETSCMRVHKNDEKKFNDILSRFLKIK
jgi:DNA-binding FrmR family transcriptional regulator